MTETARDYLPAAGRDWALPLYDPLVKLLGADAARKTLLNQAGIRPAHRVLDIGCGTGTMVALIRRLHPQAEVVGLDPDPKALARARRKAARAAVAIRFDRGYSDELPYGEASFDRVFSAFMFHHLRADQREKTLREVRRVLAPGGSFHLLDFVQPEAPAGGGWARRLHGSEHLKDNSDSRILALMTRSGFENARKLADGAICLGLLRIAYYQGSVPLEKAGLAPQPQA
jgi:ubiquinone/menaquinone biosynthesis C-methylase UbiE